MVAASTGTGWSPSYTGLIYTSTNSGFTWAPTSAPASEWRSVVSSGDGERLLAMDNGSLYLSSDAGGTWRQADVSDVWTAIGISGDGTKLFAASRPVLPVVLLYFSLDSGLTWVQTEPNPSFPWLAFASSWDGSKLAGAGNTWMGPDDAYISNDGGTNWAQANLGFGNGWASIAMSADGTKILAGGVLGLGISSDSGGTWVQVSGISASAVACSADGARLVAAGTSAIFTSSNLGVTWISNSAPVTNWSAVASSADGNTLIAAVNGGGIYTWHAPRVVPGTVLWSYDTGGPISLSPALSPDGSTIYVGSAQLLALTNSGATASVKWNSAGSSPVIGADGTVYYCSASGLVALHPTDGSQSWSYSIPGGGGGLPAIGTDGTLYVEGATYLYAVSPLGQLKWKALAGDAGNYRSPVVGPDGTIYLGIFESSQVRAYAPDGTQKWLVTLAPSLGDSPAIGVDGTLYVGADKLYALALDGSVLWSSDNAGPSGLPVISYGKTFYMNLIGRDLARINGGGQTAWNTLQNPPQYGTVTGPAIDAAGTIYYCVSNSLWAVNPQGQVQWAVTVPQAPASPNLDLAITSPVIGPDGTIYAGLGSILYAVASGTNGPAKTSWPMYRANAQHTGSLQRPVLKQPQRREDGNFKFELYAQRLGVPYAIEASTNFTTWTSLTSIVATTLPTDVTDLTATNAPFRFYRAVSSP